MNVYDKTHELAKELKDCPEYTQYKVIKEKVYADQDLKEKVKKFDQLRYEMQLLTIQGEKQNEAKIAEIKSKLDALDLKCIRAIREGGNDEDGVAFLDKYQQEINTLREELNTLE